MLGHSQDVPKKLDRSHHILIADDDPAILRLVKTVVEGEGFAAVTAVDGKEAYNILKSGVEINAAVVDVMMPYIKGIDLVKFMRGDVRFADIPVIIMTAEQNPAVSSESFNAGAVAFLPKPFSNLQLKSMLGTFIRQAAARSVK